MSLTEFQTEKWSPGGRSTSCLFPSVSRKKSHGELALIHRIRFAFSSHALLLTAGLGSSAWNIRQSHICNLTVFQLIFETRSRPDYSPGRCKQPSLSILEKTKDR